MAAEKQKSGGSKPDDLEKNLDDKLTKYFSHNFAYKTRNLTITA